MTPPVGPSPSLRAVSLRALVILVCGFLPLVTLWYAIAPVAFGDRQAVDFHFNYYYAADSGEPNQFDLSYLPSGGFDGIFALSVFTHLRLVDARQYFALIHRLLDRDGLAYLTFFVIDEDSRRFVRETGQHRELAPAGDGMWYAYAKQWFFSGYEEPLLLSLFDEYGLEVCKRSAGLWARKPGGRLWQDWFLVRRRN